MSSRLAREILAEAAAIDAREDELYGDQRGDELPEQLRTREGRRQALREAKERLAREGHEAAKTSADDERSVTVELDPGRFVTRPQRRRAWVREGRRGLEAKREDEGRPIAKDRTGRLFEASGAWRKSSTLSTPRTPPMTPGAREVSPRTARGGWRRGWSSRISRCSCQPA